MASRAVARRLACIDRVAKGSNKCMHFRGFASNASSSSSSAVADRPEKDAANVQQRPGASAPTRGRLRGFLPDFVLPFGQSTSLMHMLDTADKVFDSAFLPRSTATGGAQLPRTSNRIPWDVMEDDKCFKLRVDMPGVSKDEVNVAIENGDLTLKAEHKAEGTEDDWSSRSYGSYSMRIKLPDNVDHDAIKAELKNGVLKLVAPKVEGKAEKREVQVN